MAGTRPQSESTLGVLMEQQGTVWKQGREGEEKQELKLERSVKR